MLYGELTPFIASGSHSLQKQLIPHSTLNTFIESFSLAKPVALYLMLLENSLSYSDTTPTTDTAAAQHETFAALTQLFSLLREDDYRPSRPLAREHFPPASLTRTTS